MKVSETLRRLARSLPNTHDGSMSKASPYICDRLHGNPVALSYLWKLGMGCGMAAFGPSTFGEFSARQMHERKAWLMFAADLWDEGVAR